MISLPVFGGDNKTGFGIVALYNFNYHNMDMKDSPEKFYSPVYTTGKNNGLTVSAFYERKKSEKLNLGVRLDYNDYSSTFKATDLTYYTFTSGKKDSSYTDFEMNTNNVSVGLTPYVSYSLIENLNISAGIHFG